MTTPIKSIYRGTDEFLNQEIKVSGWARTVRSSKELGFLEINDGTFFKGMQIVFDSNLSNFDEVAKLGIGSSVEIAGTLVESQGGGQAFELKANTIEVIQVAPSEYPLQKKRHSLEFLRTIAHLRPRTNTFLATFRLRSVLSFAIHKFYQENGFVNVHTPIVTANDCEGAGEMFHVTTLEQNNIPKDDKGEVDYSKDFFGKEAGLTVSGQLEAEAFALAFRNVYTFGPTFRAENSNTARHASEFWMIEPEIAFAELKDDMALAEKMMKYLINYVLKELPEEMEFFNKFVDTGLLERLNNIKDSDFERITYTKAIEILEKADKKFEYPVKWGIDLQTEHERYITEEVFKKPVFVTDYPKDIKAFYMRMNDDNKTVAAMDLLVPGVGEIIGGSQREERLDRLEARMDEMNIKKEGMEWYMDLRKYGGVKHAGFGLGFERALMYISGVANIRDAIPFPRTPKNIEF